MGGWTQGSSKIWFRKCSVLSACLTLFGTHLPSPPGPQIPSGNKKHNCPPHPTPDLNGAEIKHHLPSMCLTNSLQEPSGKSQGIFFHCPSPESSAKAPCQQLQQGLQQTACCKDLSGLRNGLVLSWPATQAQATPDFGNSLPPSGLLELYGRAGAGGWEGHTDRGGQTAGPTEQVSAVISGSSRA